MQANRGRDTAPELALRRELHRRGRRFRVNRRPDPEIRSTADLVFAGPRVAVYVDGCFWHSCPEHAVAPANNAEWWRLKLAATVERDLRTTRDLKARGWTVIRIWEHEDPVAAADSVEKVLRRPASPPKRT
jgi:DNA mismatch endonuclease (patch repair protein)